MKILKNNEFFNYLKGLILNAKENIILDYYVIDITDLKVKEIFNIIELKKTELDNVYIFIGGVEDAEALYTNCFVFMNYKKSLKESLQFFKRQSHTKLALIDNVLLIGSHNLTSSSSDNISVAEKIDIETKKQLLEDLKKKEKLDNKTVENLCKVVTMRRPSRRKSPYNVFVS
ncbi:phosphatidylserine/phosphatidylglycerophosphate/cardiolipin synthase family protein [Saccharolobus islandicus]|uniref:PLD phosphodiesterase domain-containing protein n=1 Tax=Saccharolobus islandicus (strain M.16.4 / Kamchatka \|nr:phosphatidylserine/phosphatidylglycerophosphate/cardiolipin synthase family protein [Sulfolobus islandicus]ACR41518.1 hypothetical protein M164_0906 [Sulfolobus islandicus M.16.4]